MLVLQPYSDKLQFITFCAPWDVGPQHLQNRNSVSSKVLDLLVPSRNLKGRRVAPRVVVEGEEITTFVRWATVHVLGHLEAVGVNISSRISDRDLTITTAANVLPHITRNGLDVWGGVECLSIVDNLVTGEESQCVSVLSKSVDGREDVLEVGSVV